MNVQNYQITMNVRQKKIPRKEQRINTINNNVNDNNINCNVIHIKNAIPRSTRKVNASLNTLSIT